MIQDAVPGLLGGMIKTFKAIKEAHNADITVAHKNNFSHLESLFSTPPFFKPPAAGADDQDIVELNIGSLSSALFTFILPPPPPQSPD